MQNIWLKIIKDLSYNPRDLHTVPKINKKPLWFYAYSDGNFIYIDNAKEHLPSSNISGIRKLSLSEFERMYPIHKRREQGESVSKEAQKASINQVYWYSIFEFCLNN
jgi:hypothetical protein